MPRRCFTWPIVWLSILGTNGVLVACAYLSGSRYFDLRSEFNAHQVNGVSLGDIAGTGGYPIGNSASCFRPCTWYWGWVVPVFGGPALHSV